MQFIGFKFEGSVKISGIRFYEKLTLINSRYGVSSSIKQYLNQQINSTWGVNSNYKNEIILNQRSAVFRIDKIGLYNFYLKARTSVGNLNYQEKFFSFNIDPQDLSSSHKLKFSIFIVLFISFLFI
jgi:hypothetical protein